MLGRYFQPHLDKAFTPLASRLDEKGLRTHYVMLAGFAVGLAACFAVALQAYLFGMILFVIAALAEGAVRYMARTHFASDLVTAASYLTETLLFMLFALFFALSAPENSLASAILILSAAASGMAHFAHGWIMARRGNAEMPPAGLIETAERLVFIIVCCLYPAAFSAFAVLLALAFWAAVILRFRAILKSTIILE